MMMKNDHKWFCKDKNKKDTKNYETRMHINISNEAKQNFRALCLAVMGVTRGSYNHHCPYITSNLMGSMTAYLLFCIELISCLHSFWTSGEATLL